MELFVTLLKLLTVDPTPVKFLFPHFLNQLKPAKKVTFVTLNRPNYYYYYRVKI